MKVAVIGTGHVGLVTCVTFANIGHDVVGTDVDSEKIELLTRGVSPFYEPGLEEAIKTETSSGRLTFTLDAAGALAEAEVVFICVGTPARADGEANLVAMEQTASQIARHAHDDVVVVEKSTVPAGTADRVRTTLQREGKGLRFHMASNPEFLREGMAIHDALEPDRIVVGVESARGLDVLRRLYGPLLEAGAPLIVTDIRTAELAKHASNAFLALKISVRERVGSGVRARRCRRHHGRRHHGSRPPYRACLPQRGSRVRRLLLPQGRRRSQTSLGALRVPLPLLSEVERLNEEAVEAVAAKLREALWNLEGKRIAILGLAFKPDTDDVRFSPALALARLLLDFRCHRWSAVILERPSGAKDELPELELANDVYEAATGAHALVIGRNGRSSAGWSFPTSARS